MDAGYWVAGYNNPGYMPEMEPVASASFENAKRFLIGEMLTEGDNLADMARDEDYDAADREQYNTEAEELTAAAEGLNLEDRIGDDVSEWGETVNAVAYWIRFEPVHVSTLQLFSCAEADTLVVVWRGSLTFNVHIIDPYQAEGYDIGREVDVFSAEGPDAPTPKEALQTVERWFANYVTEQ